MKNRKVILEQRDGEKKSYRIVELHDTVEFDVGEVLFESDVNGMIRRGFKVVVRGEKVRV